MADRTLCLLSVVFISFGFLQITCLLGVSQAAGTNKALVFSKETNTSSESDGGDMNRMGKECSKSDIVIFQDQTTPLPNGIPEFTVQILNVCGSNCSISNIHVSCGWFSSARLIDPRVFRRLYYDDCIVNDGEALAPAQSLSFHYASSFRYHLSVSYVDCC